MCISTRKWSYKKYLRNPWNVNSYELINHNTAKPQCVRKIGEEGEAGNNVAKGGEEIIFSHK